jgi:hypothetical protein
MSFKLEGVRFEVDNSFHICKSDIDGKGAIASKNIKKGELIGTAIYDEEAIEPKIHGIQNDTRTRLGQIMNHQDNENAIQKSENNKLNVYAKKNIKEGEEITINYKNAPDYINKQGVENYKS